jgi:hypothetical protein
MSDMDYSDEGVIKEELQKLVDREMGATFDSLDRAQAGLEALVARVEGPKKEEVEEKILTVRKGKLEALQLFKAMHDFLA